MKVPFEKLSVSLSERYSLLKTLNSGIFLKGIQTESLELELEAFYTNTRALVVSSGTQALLLALRALGISNSDEVIVQGNVIAAGALAVAQCSATPVFMDMTEAGIYNINLSGIEKVVTSKTKAVILTHMYGELNVNIERIAKYLRARDIFLVEDCSHAHGLQNSTSLFYAGQYGDIGCFSLYPTKNLAAIGDAGYLLFSNKKWYEEVLRLRDYSGIIEISDSGSTNARCDEIQACVVRHRLKKLNENNSKRRERASWYFQNLSDLSVLGRIDGGKIGLPSLGKEHVYHQYVIRTHPAERDELREWLKAKSIQTAIHYPYPEYIHRVFDVKDKDRFPKIRWASMGMISLPLYPSMSKSAVSYVSRQIKNFFKYN